MKFTTFQIENPGCSSRRKEALIHRGSKQQQNIEPPYVGCYEVLL